MIHPAAIVDASAQIAQDCHIGAYSIVGAGVSIGAGTSIGPHVVLEGPSQIGQRNQIHAFAAIGGAPQDLKYSGEPTRLEIGDDNIVREYVTLNRGTVGGGGVTRIGSHNLFMAYAHVAHDCNVGDHVIMANAASIAGHVEVGSYATLGGFTNVHQFSRLGEYSFSGLGSTISRDVPPFVSVAGNHARAIGINKKGLQRRGFSDVTIAALHSAFRVLIKARQPRQQALEQLAPLAQEHPEVQRLIDFVLASQRSVVR